MYDIVIIGKGPAGVSAALYALRAGMNTLVIGSGTGALEKAEKIENYYGLEHPVSGTDLQKIGKRRSPRSAAA
jgi:thioredoxin reductase (NADPH)